MTSSATVTMVEANTITTAIQAGQTVSRVSAAVKDKASLRGLGGVVLIGMSLWSIL